MKKIENVDLELPEEIPSKTGYNFKGWATSKDATEIEYERKGIFKNDQDTTLYAVWVEKSYLVCKFVDYSGIHSIEGEIQEDGKATINVPTPSEYSGWTPIGWTSSTDVNAEVEIADGDTIQITENTIYYGRYSQDVTLTFIDYNETQKQETKVTGTRNVNAYDITEISNPSVTVATQNTYTGWTKIGWTESTLPTGDIVYKGGETIELTKNKTYYGVYTGIKTATFKDIFGTVAVTRMLDTTGKVNAYDVSVISNMAITIPTLNVYTDWEAVGWTTETSSTATVTYTGGEEITIANDVTYYGRYSQDVTLTFIDYNGTQKQETKLTGTRNINAYDISVVANPTITSPTIMKYSNWYVSGWTTKTAANAAREVGSGGTISGVTEDATYYARYYKDVYLRFIDMDGSTQSTTTRYGGRYVNSYNIEDEYVGSIRVPELNTYSSYEAVGWTESTSPTGDIVYTGGETINPIESKTYYGVYLTTTYTAKFIDYNGEEETTRTVEGYKYKNSYDVSVVSDATITVPTLNEYTDWEAVGWTTSNTNTAAVTYTGGEEITLTKNITYYGRYNQDVTLTFVDYNGTQRQETKVTGTRNANSYKITSINNPTITSPTISTYTDWEIVGWTTKTEADATKELASGNKKTGVTEDATYYAIYRKKVTIKFIDYYTTTTTDSSGQAVTSNNKTTRLRSDFRCINSYNISDIYTPSNTVFSLHTYSGFVSIGWTESTLPTGDIVYTGGETIELIEDKTYYGVYATKTLTAKFVDYKDTEQVTRTLDGCRYRNSYDVTNVSNTIVIVPEQNTYTGWVPIGWAKTISNTAVVAYTEGEKIEITANVTYYGRYSQDVTLTFVDYNGIQRQETKLTGTRNANSYRIATINNPTITTPTISTYSDWEVVGWTTKTEANAAKELASGDKKTGVTEDATYYAVYRKNITITYIDYLTSSGTDSSGQTVTTTSKTTRKSSGYRCANSYNISDIYNPSKTVLTVDTYSGYTAVGWAESTSPTGDIVYTGKETIDLIEDKTYYGIYKKTITATFKDIKDTKTTTTQLTGELKINSYDTKVTDNAKIEVPVQNIYTDWTAVGWDTKTATTATPTVYSGDILSISVNTTYYGLYTREAAIKYDLNGGSGTVEDSVVTRRRNTYTTTINNPKATVTSSVPSKTGCIFKGWATTSTATKATYEAGDTYTITASATSVTFYAVWEETVYNITYNLNGGTENTNPATYTVSTASFTLNEPTKNGMTFTGWTGANGSTPQKTVTIAKGSTGNRTYTANWKATISVGDFVNYDAGTWTSSEISAIGATGSSTLTTTNYTFMGYTAGQSRNDNATPYNTSYKPVASGWRIFDIDQTNNKITLISAGCPETYRHNNATNSGYISEYILSGNINSNTTSSTVSSYKARTWNEYVNTAQKATKAKVLTKSDLDSWYTKYMGVSGANTFTTATFQKIYNTPYESLIDNYAYYYLGTAYTTNTYLYANYPYNKRIYYRRAYAYGVRVLVTLENVDLTYSGRQDVTSRSVTQQYNVWNIN